jgi:hypothetical protein
MNNSTENLIVQKIQKLVEDLTAAKKASEAWSAQQPDLTLEIAEWRRQKPHSATTAATQLTWLHNNPRLLADPKVIAAKRDIARLKSELASAEDHLEALENEGTPRDAYVAMLIAAESQLPTFIQELKRYRINDPLLSTYGTTANLPQKVLDNAAISPNVIRCDLFRVGVPTLDSLKLEHGDLAVSNGYGNVTQLAKRLIDFVTGR